MRNWIYTIVRILWESRQSRLTADAAIEEMHIFPVLAKKMPAFRKELDLLTQHKEIHAGLDRFQAYLGSCAAGERELRLTEMKDLMDKFGTVLWTHLSDEVEQLGADNMRKYWTLEGERIHFAHDMRSGILN